MTTHPSGIDEDTLRHLVHRFYARVRDDAVLGPIFERAIGTDEARWAPHLSTMTDFWHTVILRKATYRGNPMRKHAAIKGIAPEHFARWLALFEEVTAELFDEPDARYIVGRAQDIGQHLSRHLFGEAAA